MYRTTNLDAANTLYERDQIHRARGEYVTAERFYKQAAAMQPITPRPRASLRSGPAKRSLTCFTRGTNLKKQTPLSRYWQQVPARTET